MTYCSPCWSINCLDRDSLIERCSAALRLRCRQIPGAAKRIAEALKVNPKLVEKWIYGEQRPTAEQLLNLAALFGEDFLDEIRGRRNVGREELLEELNRLLERVRSM